MAESGVREEVLTGGSYEILHQRLLKLEGELTAGLNALNEKRREIFGAADLKLTGEDRIVTANSCVPRDIISAGELLIFGYNVFIGLRGSVSVSDVLSVHKFDGTSLSSGVCKAFEDEAFQRDFGDLYRYYKKACFLQFLKLNGHLLMIFQIGDTVNDVKVFRFSLDGSELHYMDDRGEAEYVLPPRHFFEWKKAGQSDQVAGKHPHVSIEDLVFVECIEGDLTIKVENNTDTGEGIYSEPVDDKDQALGDAQINYAVTEGLVLLRIKPFGESSWRHFVFNPNLNSVCRVDSMEQACVPLPEGQGFIFPRGCYHQDGTMREFDADTEDMFFLECVKSPNGEDYMYVFYNAVQGRHIIFTYNIISKEVAPPVICHGYSLFEDGRMVLFSDPDGAARRIHPMQIWQTPFYGENFSSATGDGSYLAMVGNRNLVLGISQGFSIGRLVRNETPTPGLFREIIREARKMLDSNHWLGSKDCGNLKAAVSDIRTTAVAAVGEYEKMLNIKAEHNRRLEEFRNTVSALRTEAAAIATSGDIDAFVQLLERIRSCRGAAVTLRDLKYIKSEDIEEGEEELLELSAGVSESCMKILLEGDGLAPYKAGLSEAEQRIGRLKLRSECGEAGAELDATAAHLDMLTETVNNLNIDDPAKSAAVIDGITGLYAVVNRLRAALKNKSAELGAAEAEIEFAAQFKLLSQSVSNQIGLADTGAKCDELLTRTLVTLEELEGKFSDYDGLLEQLAAKRDEITAAFNTRKEQLNQAKQRRAQHLRSTALRILGGIQARAAGLKDQDSVNACFVSDSMAVKFGDCLKELRELGESVIADDLDGKFRAARDEGIRILRDKAEIFQDGGKVLNLGGRSFNVNTQPFELAAVVRDGALYTQLTGTDLLELVEDEELAGFSDIWEQELPSESAKVCRGEFLAYDIFRMGQLGEGGLSVELLQKAVEDGTLAEIVREQVLKRYDEGYERGVHDYDGTAVLASLLDTYSKCGLLRYHPSARACAMLAWRFMMDDEQRKSLHSRIASYCERGRIFNDSAISGEYVKELTELSELCIPELGLPFDGVLAKQAGEFLYFALSREDRADFPASAAASEAVGLFWQELHLKNGEEAFRKVLESLRGKPADGIFLAHSWAESFLKTRGLPDDGISWEAGYYILTGARPYGEKTGVEAEVEGMRENHPNIVKGKLSYRLDEFLLRMESYRSQDLPRFRRYRQVRKEYLERRRNELGVKELKAKTMGGFVRSRLINEVYLKLIGDNFAKQMGEAGGGRRTDQMGLLLLISPPGYGKTTLMEYVAASMGLAFMRINGPAIGNRVLSLDPAEAPNATSRMEIEKLNLAFAMSNNVMIYLDDIQHLNPEFLQKFISLCDAQRRIEGVYGGKTRTFDLRGKKVAVVMAGNPYTESGAVFKVPDMLANRADTYNLGDISSSNGDSFALSFLENCVTSNRTLSAWSKQWGDTGDLPNFVIAAERGSLEGISFVHSYSPAELEDLIRTVSYLLEVRKAVLAVNRLYIDSAAMQDEYRTEPRFKLQGSYRNMNRMAEKIYPVMNREEVAQVILEHYRNEAQTLTAGAENNLLKFKEIMGLQSEEEKIRWQEIKGEFNRRQSLGGVDTSSDMGKIMAQLSAFSGSLQQLRNTLERGFVTAGEHIGAALAEHSAPKLDVDFTPLLPVLENRKLNLEPIAEALQNQRIDLQPLVEVLKGRQVDMKPVAEALQNQKIDLQPLVEALEKQKTSRELKAVMPAEYGKAWERQLLILESLVPIVSGARDLQDTVTRLQEWLAKHG